MVTSSAQSPGSSRETSADLLLVARPRLVRLARFHGIPAHAAEDIAQETLVVAWRQRTTLRDPQRWDAWLDGICRNLCRMYYRAQQASDDSIPLDGDLETETPDATAPDLDEALERHDLEALLDKALSYLPKVTRQLVELRYLSDLTPTEVAERLGVALGTLEVRLHRARHQLRRIISTHLPAEAADFGLLMPGDPWVDWRETREWCHVCGKQMMRARFETLPNGRIDFRLRCPACSPQYGIDIHNSQGLVELDGLRSIRPALKRTIRQVNALYLTALTAEDRPCLACGAARMEMGFTDDGESGHAPPHSPALRVCCQRCGFANGVWLGGVVLLSHAAIAAQAERFILTHPRWMMLPDQPVLLDGQPAVRYRLGDALSKAEIALIATPYSLNVLAVE